MKIYLPLPWGGALEIERTPASEDKHMRMCVVICLLALMGMAVAMTAIIKG